MLILQNLLLSFILGAVGSIILDTVFESKFFVALVVINALGAILTLVVMIWS